MMTNLVLVLMLFIIALIFGAVGTVALKLLLPSSLLKKIENYHNEE